MKKEKIVVIGGSGFMGSHTADELTRRGYNVLIYDTVPSPWRQDSQKMIVGNLMDDKTLLKAFEGADCIYHFAGVADIGHARSHPLEVIEANVLGTTKALDAAVYSGTKRFIYASTMYVYSNYGSFYRASKQAAEIIIETYHEQFELDYTFLRYGSLYGPRAQAWNGIRHFISQILTEGKMDYSGSGNEMREYIHVLDAARLSVDVLDQNHKNCAITITGQQLIKVDDMISMLFEVIGKKKNVNYLKTIDRADHYGNTPYRFTPKSAKKIVPSEFVDLGQGLLDIIEEMHNELYRD